MQALGRFWSRGIGQKVAVIALTSTIVLCSCGGLLAVIGALSNGFGGGTASQSTATATTATPTARITPLPTDTAAPAVPIATAVPAGPPELGAPLSSFQKAYGSYTVVGNQYEFSQDKAQTITVSVVLTKGVASWIAVLGPDSWSTSEIMAACVAYLPADATEFNQVAQYTDYNTSLGEAVIQNNGSGSGSCIVFFAQS